MGTSRDNSVELDWDGNIISNHRPYSLSQSHSAQYTAHYTSQSPSTEMRIHPSFETSTTSTIEYNDDNDAYDDEDDDLPPPLPLTLQGTASRSEPHPKFAKNHQMRYQTFDAEAQIVSRKTTKESNNRFNKQQQFLQPAMSATNYHFKQKKIKKSKSRRNSYS